MQIDICTNCYHANAFFSLFQKVNITYSDIQTCTADYDFSPFEPLRYYAISTNIASMVAVARSSTEEGYFTTLQAYTYTDTNIATVFAGTSNGYLVKVCGVKLLQNTLEQYLSRFLLTHYFTKATMTYRNV